MPIDNCVHTFEELTKSILPQHFSRLEGAMRMPLAAERLVGFNTTAQRSV